MKYFVFALALLLSPAMAAATMRPTDFAYGMPLKLAENGAVYRLSLPWEVYATVARDDLADILIFNSADAIVPHVLRQPKKTREMQEVAEALPFFPLYRAENSAGKDGLAVRIAKGADGTIINVESGAAEGDKERKLAGYIIDASRHGERIHELDIVRPNEAENLLTTVSVESSNDLTHWSILVPRATLARLRFSGHEISSKRIPLPAKTAKYLRLSWPDGEDRLDAREILAVRPSGKPEGEWVWTEFKGEPGPAGDANKKITAYEYDSAARLPVGRVRFRFPEKNSLMKATILSRADRVAEWRWRQSGIFYDLRFDQATLVQDTVAVGLAPDRYWRVEIEGGASADSGNIPTVELGWLPHELLFVARGEGPFMLAYGSARLVAEEVGNSAPGLIAQVMGKDEEALLKEAALLPKTVLGGPDLLVPRPPPLPWRKWLLWGVLVVGVGVVASMALSLGRGMEKEG